MEDAGGMGSFGFPGMGNEGDAGASAGQSRRQDAPIQHDLQVALEDILNGCTKKMKISRKIVDANGQMTKEDKVLTIDVKPGWKAGTKVTFPKEGDRLPGSVPADVVFVIRDKPHPFFKRDGSEIIHTVKLPLRDVSANYCSYKSSKNRIVMQGVLVISVLLSALGTLWNHTSNTNVRRSKDPLESSGCHEASHTEAGARKRLATSEATRQTRRLDHQV